MLLLTHWLPALVKLHADMQVSSVCRVEEFMSQSQRISITLEQYDLPLEISRFVPEYQFRRLQY